MRLPMSVALIGLLSVCADAATADDWAKRSIYQVVTDRYARSANFDASCNITRYCGGDWAGLVSKLDYIQDMGFTAVQISPVQENLSQDTIYGEAYHGYWPQNLYELNAHFGTENDLKNLTAELHKRGMYLLLDVVTNELAIDIGDGNMTATTPIDYSMFVPFNSSSDFDAYCPIVDWTNQSEFTTCWLSSEGVATPRIKTTDPAIASTLDHWIADLVSTFNIDGIRIDGAKQIETSFFPSFVGNASVYTMGEVLEGDAGFICNYQSLIGGLENYPLYYQIIAAFTAGQMSKLVSVMQSVRAACKSPQYLANFIENQDNPRFASIVPDMALAKNALAFTILSDGIPKMYYGQEQHLTGNYSPYNRQDLWSTNYDSSAELYTLTATLNKLRNHAISVDGHYVTNWSSVLHTDPSTYVTRKGTNGFQVVAVLSNQGQKSGAYTLQVSGTADPGTNLTEVTLCNSTLVAGTNGTIDVPMGQGQPRVYFPTRQLNGSGLCGNMASDASNSTATSSNPSSTTTSGSAASASKTGAADHLQIPLWLTLAAAVMSALFTL